MRSCWRIFIVSGVFKLFGDLCGLVGPLSISFIVEFINSQLLNAPQQKTATNAPAAAETNQSNFHNETIDRTSPLIDYPDWSEFISNGWIMSGIVLIAFLLQGTFSQASTNLINMEGIKIKNALQGLIYRKTLSLSASCFNVTSKAAKQKANDDDDVKVESDDDDCDLNNPGSITNLMSDDALNVMTFFWICHYVWSIPLKVNFVTEKWMNFYSSIIAS
jgi:ABC-type multidrug transport system fused ATPase/permease subunit